MFIKLYDVNGKESEPLKLDCKFRNDLERGETDCFEFPKVDDLDDVKEIELWREAIFSDDWYVNCITVATSNNKKYFPINRWIPEDDHVFFTGMSFSKSSKKIATYIFYCCFQKLFSEFFLF